MLNAVAARSRRASPELGFNEARDCWPARASVQAASASSDLPRLTRSRAIRVRQFARSACAGHLDRPGQPAPIRRGDTTRAHIRLPVADNSPATAVRLRPTSALGRARHRDVPPALRGQRAQIGVPPARVRHGRPCGSARPAQSSIAQEIAASGRRFPCPARRLAFFP